MAKIKVFISHSSRDEQLVAALINLLRLALGLSDREIRCTSVAGYKLPAGSEVAVQLKTEVFKTSILLALVTPHSLSSSYFLFELGARWGSKKSFYPLFACGAGPSSTNDWLRAFQGINCESASDLLQLVGDVAQDLKQDVGFRGGYLGEIENVVATSKRLKESYAERYGPLDLAVRIQKQQEMVAADGDLGREIAEFWNTVNDYFVKSFRGREGVDCPPDLESLIFAAGCPEGAALPDTELRDWFAKHERRLNQDQRRMWRFVTSIYPAREESTTGDVWEHGDISPTETAKAFHFARRKIAIFFAHWVPLVGLEFVRARFGSRRGYVMLLAWLELALVRWTRHGGVGKQPLFRLAEYLNEEISS